MSPEKKVADMFSKKGLASIFDVPEELVFGEKAEAITAEDFKEFGFALKSNKEKKAKFWMSKEDFDRLGLDEVPDHIEILGSRYD